METHAFQAETQKLLDLMIHSLYSNKEVFLRELISNASDALDRRRFEAVRDPDLAAAGEPAIELVANRIDRTLTIADNGIGMSREELVRHLGTIARSGTLEFLKHSDVDAADAAPELIGQFGVGFYASFMVADEVEVVSRRAGEDKAARWTSTGAGEYTLDDAERDEAGTTITLRLKGVDGEAGISDFCDEWILRSVVKKYSDFVAYPVKLTIIEQAPRTDAAETPDAPEDDTIDVTPGTPTERVLDEPLNSMKAIWTRTEGRGRRTRNTTSSTSMSPTTGTASASSRSRPHDRGERSRLARCSTFPAKAPFDLFHREMAHGERRSSLRASRVFIMDDCRGVDA